MPFAAISSTARTTTLRSRTVADAGGGEEALLGVEDPLGSVEVGTRDGVDRRAVDPAQRVWFFDAVWWCGQGYY